MPAMTLDNAIICQHFFAGMARSYGIVATNLMAVTLQRGNPPCPHQRSVTRQGAPGQALPRWIVGTREYSAESVHGSALRLYRVKDLIQNGNLSGLAEADQR